MLKNNKCHRADILGILENYLPWYFYIWWLAIHFQVHPSDWVAWGLLPHPTKKPKANQLFILQHYWVDLSYSFWLVYNLTGSLIWPVSSDPWSLSFVTLYGFNHCLLPNSLHEPILVARIGPTCRVVFMQFPMVPHTRIILPPPQSW